MKMLTTRKLLVIILIVDIILCGAFILTNNRNNTTPAAQELSESSIRRICKLATLKCYYHNVTEWSNPGDFFNAGKKLWMEYDGIVDAGIDGSKVKISDPDQDGVVTVTIPKATILKKDLDEKSIYEINSNSPLWGFVPIYGSISTEERKEALAAAQNDMEASATHNETILDEAQERAEKIIKNNIEKIGEAAGKQYTVKFIPISETETSTTEQKSQENMTEKNEVTEPAPTAQTEET